MHTMKNYLYNLAYQFAALIVPFVTIPYISRIFGAEGIGSYAVSYSIAHYFCLFGLLGLNNYGTRTIAYCRDDNEKCREAFWNLNYMRFITMGIACILYAFFVVFVVETQKKILYLAQSGVLLASMTDISWYFAGMEEFKKTAIRGIIVKFIGMILVFLFVKSSDDIWLYTAIIAGSMLIGQIVMWGIVINRMRMLSPSFCLIKRYMRESFRFWVPAVAINMYASLDKVMLGYLVGDAEAGIYENSQKTIKLVSTITMTFTTVMMPKMSKYFMNDNFGVLKHAVFNSFKFVSMLAFPMTFGIISIRKSFVPWFYGNGFEKVSSLLIISAWLVVTLSWSNVLGNQVLIPCGRENEYTKSVIAGAIVNICLNLFLIPYFYSIGAIIASVVAEYTGMFLMMYFARDMFRFKLIVKDVLRYFVGGLFMFLVTFYIGEFLGSHIYTTFIQILLGIVVYGIYLYVLKDGFICGYLKTLNMRRKE